MSEGYNVNFHSCVAGPSANAAAAAAAKAAREAAEAARLLAEAAQAASDAAAAAAAQASADAEAAATAKAALDAAEAARLQEEAAQAASDAAAAAAAQASADAERAAAAKAAREAAEAARIQADAVKTAADAAAAAAIKASADAATAAAQAKADADAAAAAQAKAETDAEVAADLDRAAAQAKAKADAKADRERSGGSTQKRSGSAGTSASSNAGSDHNGGTGGGCRENYDSSDTIGMVDDITRTKLMAYNITLNVHFRRNMVWIQMTGPSHLWMGVSFGATVMADNPYAIVWEENHVSERLLREYSAGLIIKNSSMTYIESCYKTTPLRYSADNQPQQSSDMSIRKNTCMRPIVVGTTTTTKTRLLDTSASSGVKQARSTYYSFATLKEYGGEINFMFALGYTKSFGYHSNIFTGVLSFPAPFPEASKTTMIDAASFARFTWMIILLIIIIILIALVVWKYCFQSKSCFPKKMTTKDLPAVATTTTTTTTTTVDIEMSTNPAAASNIANPLDAFRSTHRIDHQVVAMSSNPAETETETATTETETTTKIVNPLDDFRSNHRIDHQVVAMAKITTVDTMFGTGTVAKTRDNGTQVIHLNDWKLAGDNIAVMYLPTSQNHHTVDERPEHSIGRRKKSLKVSRRKKSLQKRQNSQNQGAASSAMLCLLCLFSIICNNGGLLFCNAHNWLNNPPSRASKTSTVSPCPPADLTRPAHMQVGMNQNFEVEFMSGHSYTNTYFAIIRHENENKLKYHSEGMFQKYIANAPEGATVPAPERTHVSCSKEIVYSGWEKKLEEGDPEYIKRPGAFFGKHCNGGLHQFKYTAPMRKNDIFTSYTNPKWPWVVGIYRFKHGKSFPDEFDTVRLKIPETTGSAGRHIVQYIW